MHFRAAKATPLHIDFPPRRKEKDVYPMYQHFKDFREI